tara:strand:- start:310 stop:738 length:429 start_codon:yes stop_codon:yes gene_type:complete
MIAIVLFLLVVLYACIRLPNMQFFWGGNKYPEIFEIQKKIHEYSGVDKSIYMDYLTAMDSALETLDSQYLYKACDNLANLALTAGGGAAEDIGKLTDKLGWHVEKHIMEFSVKNGLRFDPKYLNNMFIYRQDEHDDTIGSDN